MRVRPCEPAYADRRKFTPTMMSFIVFFLFLSLFLFFVN